MTVNRNEDKTMEQFDTYELIETLKSTVSLSANRWEASAKSNERESYLADVENHFEVFEKMRRRKSIS